MPTQTKLSIGKVELVLKLEETCKDVTYNCLAEEVLGEWVEMRVLTAEAALKVNILDEITDAKELLTTHR